MKNKITCLLLSIVCLSGLFFYQNFKYNDGKLHVVFCDVGQGDAIYVKTPSGFDILFDAGPDDKVLDCLESNMPFWDKEIDMAFLSHNHADHITGFYEVFPRYNIKLFNLQKKLGEKQFSTLVNILQKKQIGIRQVKKGSSYRISDGVGIQVVGPESNSNDIKDENESSLIVNLFYNDFNLLLTGDTSAKVLTKSLAGLKDIDVFKIPHHGSKTGLDSEIFRFVKPELAIISVGENNSYNLPSHETLSILNKNNIKVLRTDIDGEVEMVVSEENDLEIQTKK